MEKQKVVFKGYGKAFQAGSGGVVVSAEDVVRALMLSLIHISEPTRPY